MQQFNNVKNIVGKALKKSKELGSKAIVKGGKAIDEAKINLDIASFKKKIKMSKIKLGDMVYQLDVKTNNKEIEELKKLIKDALEELKYLETKKSKGV